ncbi:hypothetical protein [Streptacidiphilus sp. EB129]|jgi:hypothetical protein|uniref:hypothetical protein n=1 Tax=Streptacidiphilus sp. EB129 TaxID=3156262 RepID=UPI0035176D51
MSGTGYSVDLDYLQNTITRLQGVVDGMDDTTNKANYETNLTPQQFGGSAFQEAVALHQAHDDMKTSITNMIITLKAMVQEFTDKTNHVHTTYRNNEAASAGSFGGPQ